MRPTALLSLLMLASVGCAFGAAGSYRLTTGFETTSGRYGGTGYIQDYYVPLTLDYVDKRYLLSATVPYLRVDTPANATEPVPLDYSTLGKLSSEGPVGNDGLGDIITAATIYDVLRTEQRTGFAVDSSFNVKWGTAKADKGLGTGKNDYSFESRLFHRTGGKDLLLTVGYRFRGTTPGTEIRDTWYGGADLSRFPLDGQYGVGAALNLGESAVPGRPPGAAVSFYLSDAPRRDRRGSLYVLFGLTESSPEWGLGYTLTFDLSRHTEPPTDEPGLPGP